MSRNFAEPDFAGIAEILNGKPAEEVAGVLGLVYRQGQRNALDGVRMGYEASKAFAEGNGVVRSDACMDGATYTQITRSGPAVFVRTLRALPASSDERPLLSDRIDHTGSRLRHD